MGEVQGGQAKNQKLRGGRNRRRTKELAAVARNFFVKNLSLSRSRQIYAENVTRADETTTLFGRGEDLLDMCYDKTFTEDGVWTATIDQYDPTTGIYTCTYSDGYIERLKLRELSNFKLYRKPPMQPEMQQGSGGGDDDIHTEPAGESTGTI